MYIHLFTFDTGRTTVSYTIESNHDVIEFISFDLMRQKVEREQKAKNVALIHHSVFYK